MSEQTLPRFENGEAFFDEYKEFFDTHGVRRFSNELNHRFDVIFTRNKDIFQGARVLDIASHDGRWSMAALNFGASHVTGIEGNTGLVDDSNAVFRNRNIPQDMYSFSVADMHEKLRNFQAGEFDVVLCLAVFYHTAHHSLFFDAFARMNPKCVILDTAVHKLPFHAMIRYRRSSYEKQGSTVLFEEPQTDHCFVGKPNHKWLLMAAETAGLETHELNWHDGSVKDWSRLRAYKSRGRRTYLFKPKAQRRSEAA